jgi:hypothetical protein
MLDRSYTYADYSDFSSFANSRSHAIALMVSDIRNPFLHRNFAAIEERLAGEGFDPLLGYSLGAPNRRGDCDSARAFAEWKTDRRSSPFNEVIHWSKQPAIRCPEVCGTLALCPLRSIYEPSLFPSSARAS